MERGKAQGKATTGFEDSINYAYHKFVAMKTFRHGRETQQDFKTQRIAETKPKLRWLHVDMDFFP